MSHKQHQEVSSGRMMGSFSVQRPNHLPVEEDEKRSGSSVSLSHCADQHLYSITKLSSHVRNLRVAYCSSHSFLVIVEGVNLFTVCNVCCVLHQVKKK